MEALLAFLDLITRIVGALALVGAAVVFVSKTAVKAWIEKRISHSFEKQIEDFRADIRAKETDIAALRDAVMGGAANRRAIVDKRRIEAVEKIWSAFVKLTSLKSIAQTIGVHNMQKVAERAPKEAKLQQVFKMYADAAPADALKYQDAAIEQPFISPLAWAYFNAYSSIVAVAYTTAKVIATGIDDPIGMLNLERHKEMVKLVLPERAEWIATADAFAFHLLLDELEQKLLSELKRMLEGKEDDEADIARAAKINALAKENAALNPSGLSSETSAAIEKVRLETEPK